MVVNFNLIGAPNSSQMTKMRSKMTKKQQIGHIFSNISVDFIYTTTFFTFLATSLTNEIKYIKFIKICWRFYEML